MEVFIKQVMYNTELADTCVCESYDPPVYMFTAKNMKNTPFEPPTFSHITNFSFFNASSMSFCFAPNWLFSAVYIHFCAKVSSNTEQHLAVVTEVDNTMFLLSITAYTPNGDMTLK